MNRERKLLSMPIIIILVLMLTICYANNQDTLETVSG